MLAIARHLHAAGHVVGFVSQRDLKPALAAASLAAESFGDSGASLPTPRDLPIEDERWMQRWYASDTLRGFAEPLIAGAAHAIERFRPDVICADPIAYGPIIAAARAGIPWAGVSTTLLPLAPPSFSCVMTRGFGSVRAEVVRRFAQAGVEARMAHHEVVSPWLNTVFATEAFVPRSLSGNDYSWLVSAIGSGRPHDPAFPWHLLDSRRALVYVSFGGGESLAFPEDVLLRIAAAVPAETAQLVFALQGLMDGPAAGQLPSDSIAVRRAPQLELLDRAAVVVTHGGANTVAECLRAGCPMLVLPIGHEQPLQAELVVRAGVGLALPLRASIAEIAGAFARLHTEPSFRARAAVIARSYTATNGAEAVADRLIQLARERAPQRPVC
jgi:UDP:flavonoid glycosyltransferase YjiC (YdhE family)